ncbi:uncharacterized protein LOC131939626 [Physella acuta]|uniref:uncharacterized protein LOC131939626 n=1 Tax=Physella acuta TaxID=109671 RepID=UPI0027DD73C8|nr:uncharacterized protein LOC131939626 [Physella acuta]
MSIKMFLCLMVHCVIIAVTLSQNPCPFTHSGPIANRLQTLIDENDADKDGNVTGAEIKADLTKRYDFNNDSCVTLDEWTDAWEFLKFSAEFATQRFQDIGGNSSSSCPIDVDGFDGAVIPLDVFVNGNIQSLIDMCEADRTRYHSICDCFQLQHQLCQDAYFTTFNACQKYTATVVVG